MNELKNRFMSGAAFVLVLLVLQGCSDNQVRDVIDGILGFFLLVAGLILLMMLVSCVVMLTNVVLIVLNFARPSRISMVAGYVWGGLQVVGTMSTALLIWNDPEMHGSMAETAMGLGVGLLMDIVLIGSSYYAQRKLAQQVGGEPLAHHPEGPGDPQ